MGQSFRPQGDRRRGRFGRGTLKAAAAHVGRLFLAGWFVLGRAAFAQAEIRPAEHASHSNSLAATQSSIAPGPSTPAFTRRNPDCTPEADCYRLVARYTPEQHVIRGRGAIRWTNRSSQPVTELYWHMYLNAFENRSTQFFRSPFIQARSGRPLSSPGSVRFTRLQLATPYSQSLLEGLASHTPNDPLDKTDLRVELPRPIVPGQTIEVEMEFESTLPSLVERTGWTGDFVFAGQWFPKLAVLEPDGTWAHFAFHPFAEFYADFADYEVTLELPQRFVVAASGQRTSPGDSRPCAAKDSVYAPVAGKQKSAHAPPCLPGWATYTFRAPRVHDFAWAAWPHFERLATDSRSPAVEVFFPPGHERNARRTLEVAQTAMAQFTKRFGPYPHDTLTIVHPPRHARAAGGMEYPSLITTGGAWHSTYYSSEVPSVVIHELAHQWFQGAVASNEARWPFLDEGLASYAELSESQRQLGNCSALCLPGFEVSAWQVHRANYLRVRPFTPVSSRADHFASFAQLSSVVYSQTALLLRTLGEVYGVRLLDEALRSYAMQHAGRHPTPDDLLNALKPLGTQAVTNVRAALEDGGTVDYRLSRLESVRSADGLYHNRVQVDRTGQLVFPVDILLETQAGQLPVHTWNGVERQHTISWTGTSPVHHAEVDPSQKILLDTDLLNNSADAVPSASGDWTARLTYWLELSWLWLAL